MAYSGLKEFVDSLEQIGELQRISEKVSPHLEITEIYDRVVKANGKALLFENNGTSFPVLINAYGSQKRMSAALGVSDLDDIGLQIKELLAQLGGQHDTLIDKLKLIPLLGKVSSWMPKKYKGRTAPCQEVVQATPNLSLLPILTCWPFDGGPFITLPSVHTVHPHSRVRNVGMYRMQVFDDVTTGMHWHRHKGGAAHYALYKELGLRMPIAVTLGGDPINTYVASAPLPENIDEYMLSGFLRKKKVELVKCLTNAIEVPSDADFVIEGYVDTQEEFAYEGPFGDHTGYYSLPDYFPKFHVTCITHKKQAIYPTTVVGIPPQEDGWMGKATERIFLTPLQLSVVPELVDMCMPFEGVFHNIVIAKIKKTYPGQGIKVMNALWGAGQMMFNKILVVVNQDIDISNSMVLAQLLSKEVSIQTDIHHSIGPLDILDHASDKLSFGGKLGIDATEKLEEEISSRRQIKEPTFDLTLLQQAFQEVSFHSLHALAISCLLVGVDKKQQSISSLMQAFASYSLPKFVVFIDKEVDLLRLTDVVWRSANNVDTQRDTYIKGNTFYIDGTTKTAAQDGISRDWPNIIVMDSAVIAQIDEKWARLGLGEFLPSPSLLYKAQMYGEGAIVNKKV